MSDREIGTALTRARPGGVLIVGLGSERLTRRQLLKVRLRFAWRRLRRRGSSDGRILYLPIRSTPLMPPGTAYLTGPDDPDV